MKNTNKTEKLDVPKKETVNLDSLPEEKKHKQNNYLFESNQKYFIISVYAIGVIFFSGLLIYCIMNFNRVQAIFASLFSVLAPFITAFFIAYILNPIVVRFRTLYEHKLKFPKKLSKALSIITTYIIVIGIVTITLVYIIPELSTSFVELSDKFQTIGSELENLIWKIQKAFPDIDLNALEEKTKIFIDQLVSEGPDMIKKLLPVIYNISVGVVKVIINLLLSIVISVYMLNDKKLLSKNIRRIFYAFFKKEKVDNFIVNVKECNTIFSSFIIGKSLDSLIIGIICFILMTILKLPYSVLLSVIVGITNMIPYFGPFIGAIPGVVLFLVISPIKSIIFAVMILALQQFDGLYLGPKILGNSTGLKPLWVIFGITVGGAYAGVLGMFLGVPVVGVIAHLLNKSITSRLEKKNITIDE